MEQVWVSYEKIGPFGDAIEVIDLNGVLAKVKAENTQGKYSLFCSNHIIPRRKIFGTLPQDFLMTKKYLQKQGISVAPVEITNHLNIWGIVGKTTTALNALLQALFSKDTWRIEVHATAGRKTPFTRQREQAKFNADEFKKVPQMKENVWISPYQDTYMHVSGRQDFLYDDKDARIGKRETILANTFAKENRFPGHDIIPLYIYEERWGKFYLNVGNPIKKEEKSVNDIKLEYLQVMQELKEKTMKHIDQKRES